MRVTRTVRTVRTAHRAVKLIIPSIVLIGGLSSNFMIKEYKTSMIDKRNRQTASMAKAINSEVSKRESEINKQLLHEQQKKNQMEWKAEQKKVMEDYDKSSEEFDKKADESYKEFMEKSDEMRKDAFNDGFSFDEQFDEQFDSFFDQENEQEPASESAETEKDEEDIPEETEETAVEELPDEYYIFGTVDSSGCYADKCVLYDERERLYSVDASDKPYNWAVFVKNGKAVEAWCSPETLTEATLVPYTEEQQIKQYGSIRNGSADNVTGYWHTVFE